MTFFDQLRTPSFKGFEFELASENNTFGRDVKKQKIINGNVRHEDTGEKEDVFTIEAVIGGSDDFVDRAEAFKALLNEKGAGRLILPHEGEMLAVVTNARKRTNDREVGLVYFSITFERDESALSNKSSSTSVALKDQADLTMAKALSDFTNVYNDDVPDFVSNSTLGQINDFAEELNSSIISHRSDFSVLGFVTSDAKTFGDQIISMCSDLVDYEENIDYMVSTSSSMTTASSNADDALSLVKTLVDISKDAEIDTGTISGAQSLRVTNNNAISLLAKTAAMSSAAKAVAYAEFSSKEEAIDVRDSLLNTLSSLRATAGAQGWSKSYMSIGSLMATINNDINTGLGRLPDTVTIRNQAVRSSLALAYRLYGDTSSSVIEKASDLVSRNGIIHPAFVPAEDLEVLIDA